MVGDEVKIINICIPKISLSFWLMNIRSIDLLPSKKESKDVREEVQKQNLKRIWDGAKANQHYKELLRYLSVDSPSNGAILAEYNNVYRKSGYKNNKRDRSLVLAPKIQTENMLLKDLDYNKKYEIIKLEANMKCIINAISAMFECEPFIVNRVFKQHKKNKLYD